MSILLCPVCGDELAASSDGRSVRCGQGHTFDRAKEGYLNLLRSSKRGDATGDPKAAARSRREFLDRGYYRVLRDELVRLAAAAVGSRRDDGEPGPLTVLDICCGEGYYTSAVGSVAGVEAYGFDLSKEMVRLAAKRGRATCFVANMKAIPVADGSFDMATHLFAPFVEGEFARVLKPGGTLYTVVPGARHLWGLKEVLYDTPYLNDERLPATTELVEVGRRKLSADIVLASPADIEAVFQMTPYYYRTSARDRAKLAGIETLATPVEFVIGEYRKRA